MKKAISLITIIIIILFALYCARIYADAENLTSSPTQPEPLSENITDFIDVSDNTTTITQTENVVEIIPVLIDVIVDDANVKKTYVVDETITIDGLIVSAYYDNGDVVPVSLEDCIVSFPDSTDVGDKEIKIVYKEFQHSIHIKVDHNIVPIDNIQKFSTAAELNLRCGPGTEYDSLNTIGINTEVTVIGQVVDTNWVKILYEDEEFYCSSTYLSDKPVLLTSSGCNYDEYGHFITGEPGASIDVEYAANKYWMTVVPSWLRNTYANAGWKIEISGQPLNQRFGYSVSIAGMTVYASKTIYIDNRDYIMDRTIVHELGHFIDNINGYPSRTDEFADIYYEERYQYSDVIGVGDGHHISSPQEYFASVFRDIVVLGKDSLGNIPKTYEYVSAYIQ